MHFLTKIRLIILLTVLALVLIVALQNSYPITLFFLFWRAQIDGLFLFIMIFLTGVLAGWLTFWGWKRGWSSSD